MRLLMLLAGASEQCPCSARRFRLALVLMLVIVAAAVAGSGPSQALETGVARATAAPSPVAGTWRRLSPAPVTPSLMVSVWTGRKMLIFGRAQPDAPWSVNIAAAYDPGRDAWQLLEPPPGLKGNYEGRYWAVWTGKEMLVSGPATYEAFNPATNQWRRLLSCRQARSDCKRSRRRAWRRVGCHTFALPARALTPSHRSRSSSCDGFDRPRNQSRRHSRPPPSSPSVAFLGRRRRRPRYAAHHRPRTSESRRCRPAAVSRAPCSTPCSPPPCRRPPVFRPAPRTLLLRGSGTGTRPTPCLFRRQRRIARPCL